MNRIPALDGLRGIAIALVLFDHIQGSLNNSYPWTRTGCHGIMVFFVVSGFLINSKLMESNSSLNITRYVDEHFSPQDHSRTELSGFARWS
jgi:peptidoglycan/LPS O-acetylase OafA/YrhL